MSFKDHFGITRFDDCEEETSALHNSLLADMIALHTIENKAREVLSLLNESREIKSRDKTSKKEFQDYFKNNRFGQFLFDLFLKILEHLVQTPNSNVKTQHLTKIYLIRNEILIG